jgi:predicted nucleotidyltransferase
MQSGYFSVDIEMFLQLLHEHKVKYLIVGGEAVIYYGYPRLTGDIDIFFGTSEENISKLYQALLKFWDLDIPGLSNQSDLKVKGYIIQFGVPPNRIDLMNEIDGVDFDEAWKSRNTVKYEAGKKEILLYYLSLEHLIINKAKTARNKDLDDLSYLKRL